MKTSEIESIAEQIVLLAKERNDFYTYRDFEKDFPENKNDCEKVIRSLLRIKVFKPVSNNQYEIINKRFTTFKRYRRNQAIIDWPKKYWWVLVIVTIIIAPIIVKLIPEVKKTETILKPLNIPASVDSQLNHKNDSFQAPLHRHK